jgi:hypothetical protein
VARMAAVDVMTFAGVEPGQAVAAARDATRRLDVPAPPSEPRLPLRRLMAGAWSRVTGRVLSLRAAAAAALHRRRR